MDGRAADRAGGGTGLPAAALDLDDDAPAVVLLGAIPEAAGDGDDDEEDAAAGEGVPRSIAFAETSGPDDGCATDDASMASGSETRFSSSPSRASPPANTYAPCSPSSDRANGDDIEDDIEALRARACALASAPVPDYADAFDRKNRKYQTKKYRDKLLSRIEMDEDPNSIKLANKTSDILSEFQDYISEIDAEAHGVGNILHKPGVVTGSDGKGDDAARGVIGREWTYDRKESSGSQEHMIPGRRYRTYSGSEESWGALGSDNLRDGDNNDCNNMFGYSGSWYGRGRKRYVLNHPYLHSRKFKLVMVWALVACVVLVAVIASLGGQKENTAEELLKGVPSNLGGPTGGLGDDVGTTLDADFEPMDAASPEYEVAKLPDDDEALTDLDVSLPSGALHDEDVPKVLPDDLNDNQAIPSGQGDVGQNATVDEDSAGQDALPNQDDAEQSVHSDNEDAAEQGLSLGPHDAKNNLVQANESEPIGSGAASLAIPAKAPTRAPHGDIPYSIVAASEHGSDENKLPVVDLSHATVQVDAPTALADEEAALQPRLYGRDEGWDGQTYLDAIRFCGSRGGTICPFSAICPKGEGREPLLGYLGDRSGDVWLPVLADEANEWVNLSEENTCMLYSSTYPTSLAEWGSGQGNEEMTRNVMCCEGDLRGSGAEGFVYEMAAKKYHPTWYDRSSGWQGTTFADAIQFCGMQGGRSGKGKVLCDYGAICPLTSVGYPHAAPMGDVRDEAHSWTPVGGGEPNRWVSVGTKNSCALYEDLSGEPPPWGTAGWGEKTTRHIICCEATEEDTEQSPSMASLPQIPPSSEATSAMTDVQKKYAPTWYHRDEDSVDGWTGKSYLDAMAFCAYHKSILCPPEAICEGGRGSAPIGGRRQAEEAWSPLLFPPNGWINVGSSPDSCEFYNKIHPAPPLWGLIGQHSRDDSGSDLDIKDWTAEIVCCREPLNSDNKSSEPTSLRPMGAAEAPAATSTYEQDILDTMHPQWFGREHGYKGATHSEASAFCDSIAGMVVCPKEAYCPNQEKKLFLQKTAFVGEQWAPVATYDTRENQGWIMVGTLDGESESTCSTFSDVKGMKPHGWSVDESDPKLKENVLCCLRPELLQKELNYAKQLDPIWLNWDGGSHDDGSQYCKKYGGKELCPYSAYCPNGPGQPVIGGHAEDFNWVGEQWAPLSHASNYWVQIGRKFDNSATTCMDSWELLGEQPSWGLTKERSDVKKYIMCCSL